MAQLFAHLALPAYQAKCARAGGVYIGSSEGRGSAKTESSGRRAALKRIKPQERLALLLLPGGQSRQLVQEQMGCTSVFSTHFQSPHEKWDE